MYLKKLCDFELMEETTQSKEVSRLLQRKANVSFCVEWPCFQTRQGCLYISVEVVQQCRGVGLGSAHGNDNHDSRVTQDIFKCSCLKSWRLQWAKCASVLSLHIYNTLSTTMNQQVSGIDFFCVHQHSWFYHIARLALQLVTFARTNMRCTTIAKSTFNKLLGPYVQQSVRNRCVSFSTEELRSIENDTKPDMCSGINQDTCEQISTPGEEYSHHTPGEMKFFKSTKILTKMTSQFSVHLVNNLTKWAIFCRDWVNKGAYQRRRDVVPTKLVE